MTRYSSKSPGFALVVVLMVIATLTVLGLVAIDTAVVDLEIARSHKELRDSFYLAEASAMEGIQRLLNSAAIDRKECFQFWHHSLSAVKKGDLDFTNFEHWRTSDPKEANALQSQLDPHAFLAATEERVAGGSSLIATDSRLYVNAIYGRCTKYNADALVQVGYYMRY